MSGDHILQGVDSIRAEAEISSWVARVVLPVAAQFKTAIGRRRTAVISLALSGASVPEIASFTGPGLNDVHRITGAHDLERDAELAKPAVSKLEAMATETDFARRPSMRSRGGLPSVLIFH